MPISKIDTAYRSLIISKFFKKGWGKPENLKKLFEFRKIVSDRDSCLQLVDVDYPVTITKEVSNSDSIILEGQFISPFEQYLPGLLPQVSETAYFQVLLPKKWQDAHYKPVCLHLAGTGDHFFFRRRNLMAKPLIREAGIGALLLENPFYGVRKPKDQRWSALHNVSDIFVMGGCLILESLVLYYWCKRNGFGPFGLTGISMGGHMASLAATNIPEPIVLVPCLSWTTASGVFTRGVLSSAIDWQFLEQQYLSDGSYSNEIKQMVKIIDNVYMITNAAHEMCDNFVFGPSPSSFFSLKSNTSKENALFAAGQIFAKTFPKSLLDVQKLMSGEGSGDNEEKSKDKTKTSEVHAEGILNSKSETVKTEPNPPSDAQSERESLIKLEKAKKRKMIDYLKWKTKERGKEGLTSADGNSLEGRSKMDKEKLEALQFMCGIMDECTHLKNFSKPIDTELIISVTAKADGYVPRDGCSDLQELWRGSEVRFLNTGHISAYILHQKFFRNAIIDAFEKFKSKYCKNETEEIRANENHMKR